ncbi:hypothetical protein CALVIDRAFT_537584 [Calocera viscosa TUFC12733]|uniref:RFX-type winged-helix domain-containing protein n=1 Tax=Calocera viscosa (strain TUFC12733) TaxID=1330018 RepID=A0A167LT09_CALVF|nr:hypothetical protein CALVIDRAFT_537584 [Calocera viscosa TUFC12733]
MATTPQYAYRPTGSLTPAQQAYATHYASYYSTYSTLADNYESWYMDANPTNRMVLSLRSGVARDTEWALERLLHLTKDWPERFWMKSLPGMGDALYDLAEFTLSPEAAAEGGWAGDDVDTARKRKHAAEALLVLRNASLQDHNMHYLEKHARTFPLILHALQHFGPGGKRDGQEAEFLLYAIELFHSLAPRYHLKAGSPLLRALVAVTSSPDRTLLRAALAALTALFSSAYNAHLITLDSPGFGAALRALPVLDPNPSPAPGSAQTQTQSQAQAQGGADSLPHTALDFLHTHLSHPPVAKAFFRHPLFPGTLRLLLGIVLSLQPPRAGDQPVAFAPSPPDPATSAPADPRELSQEEIAALLPLEEPRRATEWMRKLFVPDAGGALTQVTFWNLYRDVFVPPAGTTGTISAAAEGGEPPAAPAPNPPNLNASELIKNVTLAFPGAQAMVLPDRQPPTYVIRGIRQRARGELARFACRWKRGGCAGARPEWEWGREELERHLGGVHLGGGGGGAGRVQEEEGGEEDAEGEMEEDAEGEEDVDAEGEPDEDAEGEVDADADGDADADADAEGEPDTDAMDMDPAPAPAPAELVATTEAVAEQPTSVPAPAAEVPPLAPASQAQAQAQVPDLIPSPSSPQACTWFSCPHIAPNLASLRRHVLTHLPSTLPEPTRLTQRATAPSGAAAPGPLPAVATSALLVLHILFREAYPTPLPHSTSQPRTGFPFASILSQQGEEGEQRDAPQVHAHSNGNGSGSGNEETEADVEGERRARAVFRGLVGEIERLDVGKEADGEGILMRWVEEMRWRVRADAFEVWKRQ